MHVSPEKKRQVELEEQVSAACADANCSHVQVIICSCSSHINPSDIYISRSGSQAPLQITLASLPSPSLQDILNAFTPAFISSPISKFSQISQQTPLNLNSISKAGLQIRDLNLPARAKKYVRNPFRLLGLANKTRVQVQGLLSFRLLFNIWVVIVWLLVRKFFELFGVDLPPLSLSAEIQRARRDVPEEGRLDEWAEC